MKDLLSWKCRACGGTTRVIKTRMVGRQMRKRRLKCRTCGKRVTTYEREGVHI